MANNIEFSKEQLIKEIIKTDFKEKQTNKKEVVNISKIDLLRIIQKFIKLNENGGR